MIKTGKIISLIFSIVFTIQCTAQTVDTNYIDGVVYVKVKDTSSMDLSPYDFSNPQLNTLYSAFSIDTIVQPFTGLNATLDKVYRIHFSSINLIDALITDLLIIPFIEYAEKAPLYKTSFTPNDISANQYALTNIMAEQAWNVSKGSIDITIAIVDNAVSTQHEDLISNIWINPGEVNGNLLDDDLNGYTDDINGWDVSDNDNDPNPPTSAGTGSPWVHGTHCAGIASASTDNGKGIASIGFNTKIIAVKCSPDNSSDNGATLPNAYDGVYYAMRAGADIISMSWGGTSGIFLTGESLVNTANNLGIVLIAAAGNNNSTNPFYPAAYSNVLSVGATDENDKKASFSNYGPQIDLMAPGLTIFSTLSGGNNDAYGFSSGTSMACPLVAGLAALILDQNPGSTPQQVKQGLINGCDNIDGLNPGFEGDLGAGRINAMNSLNAPTGIEEQFLTELTVYPNPSKGTFNLRSRNLIGSFFRIYNTVGKEIYRSEIVVDIQPIRVELTPGMYILAVEGQASQKLIVNQ